MTVQIELKSFDSFVISLFDYEIALGNFKKEICEILKIPLKEIVDVKLIKSGFNGGVNQGIHITFSEYTTFPRENLLKLPFDELQNNVMVFKIGDSFL